jgi:hypothetical protein
MSILDTLPNIIKKNIDESDVASVNEEVTKPFIVVHSRPLTVEEKELLRSYGTVLDWHPSFQNIPIEKHKFDYLLVDINVKESRLLLMKSDLQEYNVVCLIKRYEIEDDFIEDCQCVNIHKSLPPRQAFKADFDKLLLSPKIRAPSCAKSVLRIFLNLFNGFGKK